MSLPAWFGGRAWWLGQVVAGEGFANAQRPTAREQQRTYDYYVRVFPQFVLCRFCRRHYRRLVVASPPDVADRDRLFAWFSAIHDAVNKRLRRPAFGVERARAAYARLSAIDKYAIVRDALQLLAFEYSLYDADRSARQTETGDGGGANRTDGTAGRRDDEENARDNDGGDDDNGDGDGDNGADGGESDADWSNVDEALRGAWFYTRAPYAMRTVCRSDYRTDAGWWFAAYVDATRPFVASAVAADRLPYATLDDAWRAYGVEKARVYRRVRDSQLERKKQRTSAAAAAGGAMRKASAAPPVRMTRGQTVRARLRRRAFRPPPTSAAAAGGDGAEDFVAADSETKPSRASWRSATVAGVALVGVVLIAYCISATRRSVRGRNRRPSSRTLGHCAPTARPTKRPAATSDDEPRSSE